MNNKLYLKAVVNIRDEIEAEIQERTNDEYRRLVDNSLMRKANTQELKEIKELLKQSKKLQRSGFGDFYTWNIQSTIKEYAKTGRYNPRALSGIRKAIAIRT